VLNGGAGNDTLTGGAGADTLIGGAGSDTASYVTSGAAVTIDLLAGTGSGGDADGDAFSQIENIVGSAFNDSLIGRCASRQLLLNGGAGDDTLRGGAGASTQHQRRHRHRCGRLYRFDRSAVTVNLAPASTPAVMRGRRCADQHRERDRFGPTMTF
jgi:Ca2+-binding RTX toxin-like protein